MKGGAATRPVLEIAPAPETWDILSVTNTSPSSKPMSTLNRAALALLLLFPAATSAQDLDKAVSAVVKISGTKDGTPVRGSGFVVGLDHDKAAIVTASHVIEGVQQLEVTFGVDSTQSFPAGRVLGMETGNPRGLAVFQVSGALPAGVITLTFETEAQLQRGEDIYLLGYPYMAMKPLALRMTFSSPDGNFLQLSPAAGDGGSGAPVLRQGKVLGVVVDETPQLSFAVNALVARAALNGWSIKLGEQSSAQTTNSATQTKPAEPEDKHGGQRTDPFDFFFGPRHPPASEDKLGGPSSTPAPSTAWLNIQYQGLSSDLRSTYGIPEKTSGVVVTYVNPDSEASEQYLREGCTISEVNGHSVKSIDEFEKAVESARSGSYLRLYVLAYRLGKEQPFFVVLKAP